MTTVIHSSILSIALAAVISGKCLAQSKGNINKGLIAAVISQIDEAAVEEFRKAWCVAGGGVREIEGVVLLYRKPDGSLTARLQGQTNQRRRFTITWNPEVIAIVHTHPNSCNAEPEGEDLEIADRMGIPVFTITSRGMYVYDPDAKKITKVQDGLDWLDAAKWDRGTALTPEPQAQGPGKVRFTPSIFDREIVGELGRAWSRTGNGTRRTESVVLVLATGDGSYRARLLGSTNQYRRLTFTWDPATIAVIHTHPNDSDPKPQESDIQLADRFGVLMFTITRTGMYMYDPGTKSVSKVKEGLDWVVPSSWEQALLPQTTDKKSILYKGLCKCALFI